MPGTTSVALTEEGSGFYVNKISSDTDDKWAANGTLTASTETVFLGGGYAVSHEYWIKVDTVYSGGESYYTSPTGRNGSWTRQGEDHLVQSELFAHSHGSNTTVTTVNGVVQTPTTSGFSSTTHNADASTSNSGEYHDVWTQYTPSESKFGHYDHVWEYTREDHLRSTLNGSSSGNGGVTEWGSGHIFNDAGGEETTITHPSSGSSSGSGGGTGQGTSSTVEIPGSYENRPLVLNNYSFGIVLVRAIDLFKESQ